MAEIEERLLQPLTIDYAQFRKRFVAKKKASWARPMIWMDAEEPSTVNRSLSEGDAIVNVLEQARHTFRYRSDLFTREERLQETRIAHDYALAHGLGIIRFLMFILLMSDEHCRRMLIMAGRAGNVAKVTPEFHSISRAQSHNEKDIKRYVAGLKKPCPGRPFNKASCDRFVTANHGICWHCLQMYGMTRNEWPNWLVALVQDDDREYRLRAIEALYHREINEETAIAA